MFMALADWVPTGAANVSLPCDDGGLLLARRDDPRLG
jgi:hypothetical protein